MDEFLNPGGQEELWIGACAHQLQRRWRTMDPDDLEDVAASLAKDPELRALAPAEAAAVWLRPIGGEDPGAG